MSWDRETNFSLEVLFTAGSAWLARGGPRELQSDNIVMVRENMDLFCGATAIFGDGFVKSFLMFWFGPSTKAVSQDIVFASDSIRVPQEAGLPLHLTE